MGAIAKNEDSRNKFFDMCHRIGWWNISVMSAGKELSVPHQTVSRWKHEYIEEFGIPDAKEFGKELNVNYKTAIIELMRLIKGSSDERVRVMAIKTLGDFGDKYTDMLERYNFKDITPQVVRIDSNYKEIVGLLD